MANMNAGSGGASGGGGGKGGGKPTGYLGTQAMSAEDLNSAMRGDIQASYLKGPVQKSYVGMGPESTAAVRNLAESANNGNRRVLDQAYNFNSGLLRSGGFNPYQTDAIDYTRGVMAGGAQDEGYQRLRQNAMDDARTAINRQFGASGRFGAGSHVEDTARGIFDAAAGLDYQNLQRRDAAAGNLFNMGQTGTANAMGAADRAPDMFQNMLLPYQTQVQAYSLLDADNRARAEFDPNYQHLLKYQGLLSGNAANPQPAKQPGFMDYAGLGLGLLTQFL